MKSLFSLQTKDINFAAFLLGISYFFSAILGLIRDRLLARTFGAGNELDIYYASFKIPDFITMIFFIGAIGAGLVPIFSENLVKNKKIAFEYLANFLNIFLLLISFLCLILFFLFPYLVPLITPGFSPEKRELVVTLGRIMLLSPIFLGLGSIISAVLRVFQRFFITALSPIMYNLGIISGILFFFPLFGLPGLAIGAIVGAFFHFAIQLYPLFLLGFRPKKIFNFFDSALQKTLKLTLPRSLALGANQINLLIITAIASFLPAGSIAVLNLAESLIKPVLSFIGIPFSSAVFPNLSLVFSKRDFHKFRKIFSDTLKKLFFLLFPTVIVLFLAKHLIVSLILKTGKFGSSEVQLTSACLGLFCLGVFAQCFLLLINKGFYAMQETKIPALVTILGVILNLFLCLLFIKAFSFPNFFRNFFGSLFGLDSFQDIRILALPLATSLSSFSQFLILLKLFLRKEIFSK